MNLYHDVRSPNLAAYLLAAACLSAGLVSGCGENKAQELARIRKSDDRLPEGDDLSFL